MAKHRKQQIRKELLAWYKQHQRDLAWRRTGDPYAIWLSEVMLQQTKVTTAQPYFEQFLTKFPNIEALAHAPLNEVLKLWEGLGYYTRARNLHKAAQKVVAEFQGKLPSDLKSLKRLPGIGAYTAGAIASIAFGQDEPAVDGNAVRVLSRLQRVHDNVRAPATLNAIWDFARELLPKGQAGDFNQALMDFGASVCVPKKPKCQTCPLHDLCNARLHNEQEVLPHKPARKTVPHHDVGVGILWRAGRLLMVQRPTHKLLGGLWEFPGGKRRGAETLEACVVRCLEQKLGIDVQVNKRLTSVKHAFTHFRISMHAFLCELLDGEATPIEVAGCEWVHPNDINQYALPKAALKVVEQLRQEV